MATDDERREAAERLREKSRKYARALSSSHTSTNAYHEVREVLYGTDGAPKSLCEFFDRLADLIDPGDSSLSCRDAVVCDREALLALAEDVDGAADDSGGFEPLAGMLRDIARSIREACGEVVA